MDGVARRRDECDVSRLHEHPQQVREALLGADRDDDLALGIELDAEPPRVALGDRGAEVRDSTAGRVAVVARHRGRFLELRDSDARRGNVWVAEPQIDDVLVRAAELELEPFDLRERVGREQADAAEGDHPSKLYRQKLLYFW